MAAIWGISGTTDESDASEIGRRLQHRGRHEFEWAPAPHVRFAWRQDDATPISVTPPPPLMFTGAICNRHELVHRLGHCASEVSPRGDAALLWELYCREGPNVFASINGQFAVALYDARADEVVLAADRWATQPLYIARVADSWAFATEYRALLALPQLVPRVDTQSLAFLNATKYLPPRKGLLSDVSPVAPGEIVRISRTQCQPQPYSALTLVPVANAREPVLASNLRDALLSATASATAGYGRIGIALSAGLDSTLTLGLVRAVVGDLPIHTYTATFDANDPDLLRADEAARHFNTIHTEIVIAPEDLPRLLGELVWTMEDPCAREEMLVYHVLAQQAAVDVPIVLYGHMADLLFGGMPRHLLIKLAGSLRYARGPLTEFYDYTQTGALPRSVFGRLLVAAYYRGRQSPAARVLDDAGALAEARLHLADDEPLNNALIEAIRHPTEVAAMERLHARAGVRFGSVFHDPRVAEAAFHVPDRLKIRGGCRKYILRCAARGILPKSFSARPKGMIRIARDPRLRQVIEAMAAELLAPRIVTRRRLFDPHDVARLVRHWHDSGEQFYRIWTLLLVELWCRAFIDGRGAMLPTRNG
jgi:asparagine synthase (glutamine-hydrolysing)